MSLFNLHTHTHYCDGAEPPEAYIRQALDMGFDLLGFSGHAPVPFENRFAIPDDRFPDYINELRNLRDRYKEQIRILIAVEADYIPGITRDFDYFREAGRLDYVIGGVHLINRQGTEGLWFIDGPRRESYDEGLMKLFNGNARRGVEAYYHHLMEMVATQHPDIIAHFDKIKMHNQERFFSEEEGWYRDLVWKALKFIAGESNAVIEVNTRGIYKKRCDDFFPSPWILEQVHHLGIPVTVSTDAHRPEELNLFRDEALALLRDIGFRDIWRPEVH
ncbi:MAG: histidinol-phosphatase [Bacteroidales bacterium]